MAEKRRQRKGEGRIFVFWKCLNMTYVIEHLECHNAVISPETVEVQAKNLLSEAFLAFPSNSFDNLNSGKTPQLFAFLITQVQSLLMKTVFKREQGLSASLV
jgi:hypothetical protein